MAHEDHALEALLAGERQGQARSRAQAVRAVAARGRARPRREACEAKGHLSALQRALTIPVGVMVIRAEEADF